MLLRLHEAVAAVCPVLGVSGDSAAVRLDFAPAATTEQRAAAQAVADAFDWSPEAQAAWEKERTRAQSLSTLLSRADTTGFQVRAVIDAVCTLANDVFEELGKGRPLVAANVLAYLSANPTAGDPQ